MKTEFFSNCYTVQLLYQLSWHNKFALQLDSWWSSLEVSLSCVVGSMHTKWEGGVYAHPYALSVHKCEVTGEKSWRTWNPRMHGDTDKEVQVWRGSLVSLSFQPCSSLRGCLCFLLSHCRRSQSCSYHHYALHCSHECGMAAWQRGYVQHISITWMGQPRSVGRSMHMVL